MKNLCYTYGMTMVHFWYAYIRIIRAMRFTSKPLKTVDSFKYLGRPLSRTGNDVPAMHTNLKKARAHCTQVFRVLTCERLHPRVCAMFYKAIVQTVLPYGSETWAITSSIMKETLEGFHQRVAQMLANWTSFFSEAQQEWVYPNLA